jgi:hypothetical protein
MAVRGAPREPMFLLGTVVSGDGEISIVADRFDPGVMRADGPQPTAAVLGDVVIPVRFCADAHVTDRVSGDYVQLCTDLHAACCGSMPVHATSFVALSARCSLDLSHTLQLHFEALCPATTITATPLAAVPLVPTAHLRRLTFQQSMLCSASSSGGSSSSMPSTMDFGFLSMDSTRKLLCMVRSDPQVCLRPSAKRGKVCF